MCTVQYSRFLNFYYFLQAVQALRGGEGSPGHGREAVRAGGRCKKEVVVLLAKKKKKKTHKLKHPPGPTNIGNKTR